MSRQWAQKKSGSNSSMLVQKSSSSQRPFTAPIYDAPAPQQTPSVQAKRRNVDWSRVTVEAQSPAGVQAKLSVGAPGDKYEQEADSMATKVMTMPDSAIQQPIQRQTEEETEAVQMQPLVNSITPLVQRSSGEEEEVQMKSGVQRASDGSSQASGSVENRLAGSKGGGSALPDDVRSFMEPRFGADFSGVRVHTDSNAVQMNKELGAQAFAHGSDIYYGAGKAPGNNELTAHELTHVVQQTGAVQTKEASNKPNVQLKCSACDEEAKVQKSLDISAVSKSEIQRWSLFGDDEEKEPENSSGGGILDWAKEKASGAVDSVPSWEKIASETACEVLNDEQIYDLFINFYFSGQPNARKHLEHYLKGRGKDYTENVQDLFGANPRVRSRMAQLIDEQMTEDPTTTSNTLVGKGVDDGAEPPIRQSDYDSQDWRNANGNIDEVYWQVIGTYDPAGYNKFQITITDPYGWHPLEKRPTQCLHEAFERLKSKSAADYITRGTAEILLPPVRQSPDVPIKSEL